MAANVSVTNNFVAGTPAVADSVDQNFTDIITWINTNAVHLDGSKAFTAVPSGPATDPTSANQYTRKQYVDNKISSGTSGSRPTGIPTGSLFWETDKSRLRVYNGSSWTLLAGLMGCVTSSSTGLAIANGASSNLVHGNVVSNTDSFVTAGSSTITVPEAGTYAILLDLSYSGAPASNFGSMLTVTAAGRAFEFAIPTTSGSAASFSLTVPMGASDTIVFNITNSTNASCTYSHYCAVRRVSA